MLFIDPAVSDIYFSFVPNVYFFTAGKEEGAPPDTAGEGS